MGRLGGLGRGLTDRAKDLGNQTKDLGTQAAQNIPKMTGNADVGDDAQASEADSHAVAAQVQQYIAAHRPPPGPVRGTWGIGIGQMLAAFPQTPDKLRGIVTKLDRFGGVEVTESSLSLDGSSIDWSSVQEIRTLSLVDYLLSGAINQQVKNLPIPWFPGRGRLVSAITNALATLLMTAAHAQLDRGTDIQIPAEIHYRGGLGRRRELAPGMLATLLLADPAVAQCFAATAAAHRIPIGPSDDASMWTNRARADELRARLGTIEGTLRTSGPTLDAPQ